MLRFDSKEEALVWANRSTNQVEKQEKRIKKPNILIPSEHEEQKNFIYWTEIIKNKYPGLDLIYAIPNGGDRNEVVAAKLTAEGVKKGVPDLCLPVPRGTYHGMYIEMKRIDGGDGTSSEQEKYIEALIKQGYFVVVCNGFKEAQKAIINYYSFGGFCHG